MAFEEHTGSRGLTLNLMRGRKRPVFTGESSGTQIETRRKQFM